MVSLGHRRGVTSSWGQLRPLSSSLGKRPPDLCQAGIGSSLEMSILTHVYLSAETCPQPAVPLNGRMLGQNVRVGHDIHFVCNAGFRLVGSETRTCRHNRTWSGTQPFCRSEVEQGWAAGGSSITLSCRVPLCCSLSCRDSSPEAAAMGTEAGQQDGVRMGFSSWCSRAPSPQVSTTAPATRVPMVGPVWMAARATRASAPRAGQAPAARAPSMPVGAWVWAMEGGDAHRHSTRPCCTHLPMLPCHFSPHPSPCAPHPGSDTLYPLQTG